MYSFIISQMKWSFSRVTSFESCPYKFFLKYIQSIDTEAPMFFSRYGSFIHSLLEKFYSGKMTRKEIVTKYLCEFRWRTRGDVPSQSVYMKYFQDGLDYLENLMPLEGTVLSVEEMVNYEANGNDFIGFIDLVYTDVNGKLCIMDHKSRGLKPRSQRKKPTKSDEELDHYLRQLYLYSIPVKEKYGKYPDILQFNCFRTGTVISEPFKTEKLEQTKEWVSGAIGNITSTQSFKPDIEFFKCRYLCELKDECEYFNMAGE